MSSYVIQKPRQADIPVAATKARFPVHRVYCIGRNYAAHTIEMGGDPNREVPFFFQKNPDNINSSGIFPYPPQSNNVHHEVELAVALASGGSKIPVDQALDHVWGYSVALDMTRRDLQAQAKKMRRPWELGKAFEQSAPIGSLYPQSQVGHLSAGSIQLTVNGEIRQQGDLAQMIWKVPEIISYLSEYFELAGGDIILTGTPSGVGPVAAGDHMVAEIEGLEQLSVQIV